MFKPSLTFQFVKSVLFNPNPKRDSNVACRMTAIVPYFEVYPVLLPNQKGQEFPFWKRENIGPVGSKPILSTIKDGRSARRESLGIAISFVYVYQAYFS